MPHQMTTPSTSSKTPETEAVEYIRDMLKSMQPIAIENGMPVLAALIEIAAKEAAGELAHRIS